MLRLLPVFVALVALNVSFTIHPVQAAPTPAKQHLVRLMIRFAGPPEAADPNLKTRDSWTRGHLRVDPYLATAKSYSSQLVRFQQAELAYVRSKGVSIQPVREFHLLFDGFAAMVPQSEENKLRGLTNVASVMPDRMNVLMDDHSLRLIHAQQAWAQLGGSIDAGKSLYIATVDTGIQTNNPCFSDKGMPAPSIGRRADNNGDYALTNNKVVVARAFGSHPGTQYNAQDVEGHGTFVAAIEACDYNTATPLGTTISGVAPAAYLMNYDVYPKGDDQRGPEDSAIAAFEAALQDGADVVNFSSGFPTGAGDEREDPEVAAINTEAQAGLVMVISAGNAGPSPMTISSPSTADSAISVGASTNDQNVSESVSVTGPGTVPASLTHLRAVQGDHPFTNTVGPAPIVPAGYGRIPGDPSTHQANDFAGLDLQGKIALIERGDGEPFENKINNAAHAGAIGVVVWDNQNEVDYPVMEEQSATLPAMLISQTDGQALLNWLKLHPDATLVMDPKKTLKPETADVLSDFSSRGYGPDYRIKPDLVAPGQDIYSAAQSTTPLGDLYDSSGFTAADGTSFSAPHVSGAVALLLQQHPTWTPTQVKAVLMETASIDSLTDPSNPTPSVMDVGAGLLDLQSALAANAYITPFSASVGQANVGYGAQSQSVTLTLHDAGSGSGTWNATVDQLHPVDGLTVSVPPTVSLTAGGQVDLALHLAEAGTTKPGDYDGYVMLTRGDQTLHVPYFVHVASEAVASGSVLLVDASTSDFQPAPPTAPIQHMDVSHYYEAALQSLGKQYTYWNNAVQGSPSLADMKRASAVIYFTGANLNFFAKQNSDPEALLGPLNTIDLSSLHSYLDGGGRVFISGMGAALSDDAWDAFVLGAQQGGLSEYDNTTNDKTSTGGKSPPSPSAVVDKRQFGRENRYLFAGLKAIDFSTKGDGAADNVAVNNTAVGSLVGVTDLDPFTANDSFYGTSYGEAALRTTDVAHDDGSGDVAVVNSDEPSLKHTAKLKGRSVLFSFGFEGINDNTGYATREQVLRRIFQWFGDTPTAQVIHTSYAAHRSVNLRATLKSGAGVKAVQYAWEVGTQLLKATPAPTTFTFPHAGNFRVRVQITDSLGHQAVSPWTVVKVT